MHPTDDAPPLEPPTWDWGPMFSRVVEHMKARLAFLAADPDGELAFTARVLAAKRGSRR